MTWKVRVYNRVLEWLFASYTLLFGLVLAGPNDSVNPINQIVVLSIAPEPVWALLFAVVGAFHCIALGINGAAWWTPIVRTVCAGLNFIAYVTFSYALWLSSPWSTGVPTYAYLVSGGLAVVWYRALTESFLVRRAKRGADATQS